MLGRIHTCKIHLLIRWLKFAQFVLFCFVFSGGGILQLMLQVIKCIFTLSKFPVLFFKWESIQKNPIKQYWWLIIFRFLSFAKTLYLSHWPDLTIVFFVGSCFSPKVKLSA